MKVPSIWSSVEADCWSRNFDYDNYLAYHKKSGCISTPMTKDGYALLCRALDYDMKEKLEAAGIEIEYERP